MARIATVKQAHALLAQRGVITLTATRPEIPALVELVAGERVRGSWWSHAHGAAIFNIASDLEDAPDVLSMKLVDKKVAFVHERLFPALYRVLTDTSFVKARSAKLGKLAAAMRDETEREGTLRLDLYVASEGLDRKVATKAKSELEASLIVIVGQEHSESGKHVTVLRSLKSWASKKTRAAAEKLTREKAEAQLAECGVTF